MKCRLLLSSLLSIRFLATWVRGVDGDNSPASLRHLKSNRSFYRKFDLTFETRGGRDEPDAAAVPDGAAGGGIFVENSPVNTKNMKMNSKSSMGVFRMMVTGKMYHMGKRMKKRKGRNRKTGKGMGKGKGRPMPMTAPRPRPRPRYQTRAPTAVPTGRIETRTPTSRPTKSPSVSPSSVPSAQRTDVPSEMPSVTPTARPSSTPSRRPSATPTTSPSASPTARPTTDMPSTAPTTAVPTVTPTNSPTQAPTLWTRVEITGRLFNTGVDDFGILLPVGSVDPHYVVVETGQQAVKTRDVNEYSRFPEDGGSGWIWETIDNLPTNVARSFETTFDLSGYDPETAIVTGAWAADDVGLVVSINGRSTGLTTDDPSKLASFSISSGFQIGLNRLSFTIRDDGVAGGLRVDNMRLRAKRVFN